MSSIRKTKKLNKKKWLKRAVQYQFEQHVREAALAVARDTTYHVVDIALHNFAVKVQDLVAPCWHSELLKRLTSHKQEYKLSLTKAVDDMG